MLINAYAKVNLGLSVLGRRADGFHDVDTLMVRLELHDTVTLKPTEKGVRLELSGTDLGLPPEQNLAYRAAALYLHEAGEVRGVDIGLEKRIPVAAGLGGGSADAGAVLRGLAQLYPADVDILTLAAQLGSDVAFFTADLSAARATGRGEQLGHVTVPELQLVLVNPGVGVSAGDAYGQLEKLTEPLEPNTILGQLGKNEEPDYFNALESGVVGLEPVIGEVLAVLRQTGLRGVLLSGSGSSCFGLAESRREAQLLAATLQEAYPKWWVLAAHTL